MSYDSDEKSVASGQPVELYLISAETGQTWRYNTSPEGVIINYASHDYIPENIERQQYKISEKSFLNDLEIIFGRDNEFILQFVSAPIEGRVNLTVIRGHGSNYVTFWRGQMISITFDTNGKGKCKFSPNISSMPRIGKRRRVSRLCNHVLFKAGCNLNDSAYRVPGTLSNIDGLDLTSSVFSGYSDGYFQGGKIYIGTAKRLITAHTTDTITIDRAFPDDVVAGSNFDAYPGCPHTPTACIAYGNIINYGGNQHLPLVNLFENSIDSMSGSNEITVIMDGIIRG